jgi:purine-binding chemotaxis protein CheW
VALAREPAARVAEPTVEIVEFSLATERYGIETSYVLEVFPFKDLTPVPGAPAFFPGIVNVRGRMIAVLDLKKFFDLPVPGLHDLHKAILLHSAEMDLGLLADDVAGVRSVPLRELQSSLPTLTGVRERYLRGVSGSGLVVLDAGKLLADPALLVDEKER